MSKDLVLDRNDMEQMVVAKKKVSFIATLGEVLARHQAEVITGAEIWLSCRMAGKNMNKE